MAGKWAVKKAVPLAVLWDSSAEMTAGTTADRWAALKVGTRVARSAACLADLLVVLMVE